MPIEQMIPKIFAHVDLDKWGTRRPELVILVAELQAGGANPVPLGKQILAAMGRTARQARQDHARLVELAEIHQVLTRWRGAGRTPDAWAVTDVSRWRKIPWRGSRRHVVHAFSSPLPGAAVDLWAISPGQPWSRGPLDPEFDLETDTVSRSGGGASTPRQGASTPRPPREKVPSGGIYATESSAPLSMPLTSSYEEVSSSSSSEEEEHLRSQTKALGLAIAAQIGKPNLFAGPLHTVETVVRRHPGRGAELAALVAALGGIFGPQEAADTFAAQADRAAAEGWPGVRPPVSLYDWYPEIDDTQPDPSGSERIAQLRSQLRSRITDPGDA